MLIFMVLANPKMLGLNGQPKSEDGKTLEPMEAHGIQAMSIGFLIDDETPMIWRGPHGHSSSRAVII
ncbi:MAG: hypothetical protein CM15mP93_01440 [Thiotrichaceae bacterium]|nr:MAG: hypothetical protein CM15mP93_01440 [Thiotrichaceae bacterium]